MAKKLTKKATKKLQKFVNAKATKVYEGEVIVKNADVEIDTTPKVLIQNKIDYTPKVSVIIPVYNVEEYLCKCLDSVINQTLKEIEIICVDDGSTDNSLEILKEYATKDNRITIITQKNLYAGVARNSGLAQAKGEYLSFLDSDDFFELNMLKESYKKAIAEKADIVIFGYKQYNVLDKSVTIKNGFNDKLLQFDNKSSEYKKHIFEITNPMPWNKLYSSRYIKSKQIQFQALPVANDLYFVYAAILLEVCNCYYLFARCWCLSF